MTSPFPDELISAYLDGELTAQEREYVEAQLRENAALRRMCDELRTLRLTLQSLPMVEPPENLTERILRQAERRMLTGDPTPPAVSLEAATMRPATKPRVLLKWRLTLAVAATLAASILVFLWLPQLGSQRIAHAPSAASQDPPDTAAVKEEKLSTEIAVEESFDSTTRSAVKAEAARALSASEDRTLSLQVLPPTAPTPATPAPAAPEIAVSAKGTFKTDQAPGEPLPAASSFGLAGAGGMPGRGRAAGVVPEADETMRAGGMGGGAGFGPAERLTEDAARPDMPMGPGMSGGSSAGRDEAGEESRGATATDAPHAGTAGAPRDLREMETTLAEPATSSTPASELQGDVAGATSDLRRAKNKQDAYRFVEGRRPLINELVARFDQDAKLLVKVHGDPAELVPVLRALPQAVQVDEPPTEASGKSLTKKTNPPTSEPQADAAVNEGVENSQYGSATHAGVALASGNVFVIQGSTDQIRQTLTDLSALSSVDIDADPATLEMLGRRLRQLSTDAGAVEAPSRVVDRKPAADAAAAASLADKDVAETPDPADTFNLPAERAEQLAKDAASGKATVYLYFHLRPEVVPPAPAAKPDDR